MSDARAKAEELARHLFTNGSGQHAHRLVLLLDDDRNGGGWGERVIADRLADALESHAAAETARAEAAGALVGRMRAWIYAHHEREVAHSDATGGLVKPPVEWCDTCRDFLLADAGQAGEEWRALKNLETVCRNAFVMPPQWLIDALRACNEARQSDKSLKDSSRSIGVE